MLLRPGSRDLVRHGAFVAWWTRRFDLFDLRLTVPSAQRTQAAVRIGMRGPIGLLYLSIIRQFFGNLLSSFTVEARWSLGGVFPSRAVSSTAARQEPRDNDKCF